MATLRNIPSTILERKCFFDNPDNKALDTYSKYDKVLLVGDFNTEISE